MKKFTITSLIILFTMSFAFSQSHEWRRYRHELVFGGGTTAFMGELGGGAGIGTHFVKDFDFLASRWSFQAGYGYKFTDRWALRAAAYYGRVYGSDELTTDPSRSGRNLYFRSPIIELSTVIEFSILRESYGHRYSFKHIKGKRPTPNLYIFAGVGGFWFNPRAQYLPSDPNAEHYGEWFSLQKLGTEGQGIIPTRPTYSRIQFCIPFGIGINCLLNRQWGVGFDYGFRYTFTDYIDDVSNTYVSTDIFDDPIAAYFADPTCGEFIGSNPGDQRGQNKYPDVYMFLTVKVTYKIASRNRQRSKF